MQSYPESVIAQACLHPALTEAALKDKGVGSKIFSVVGRPSRLYEAFPNTYIIPFVFKTIVNESPQAIC